MLEPDFPPNGVSDAGHSAPPSQAPKCDLAEEERILAKRPTDRCGFSDEGAQGPGSVCGLRSGQAACPTKLEERRRKRLYVFSVRGRGGKAGGVGDEMAEGLAGLREGAAIGQRDIRLPGLAP